MPARGLQHVDLCVRDVGRSLVEDHYAFFVFDPDGLRIEVFCAKRPHWQKAAGR